MQLERLRRERAMIELEMQSIEKNLAYCKQEQSETTKKIQEQHDTERNKLGLA
jgi:hypothetical protein